MTAASEDPSRTSGSGAVDTTDRSRSGAVDVAFDEVAAEHHRHVDHVDGVAVADDLAELERVAEPLRRRTLVVAVVDELGRAVVEGPRVVAQIDAGAGREEELGGGRREARRAGALPGWFRD